MSRHLLLIGISSLLLSFWLLRLFRKARMPERFRFMLRRATLSLLLADLLLWLAGLALVLSYDSWDLVAITEQLRLPGMNHNLAVMMASYGLVLSVVIKTALFPFHNWLTVTLATPTPLSALLHAGVINAGGYLLLRFRGLLEAQWGALALAALIGLVSALLFALRMNVQNDVKNKLLDSTRAQMGFMILQCGLTAWGAALFHIFSHAIYKAFSFLNAGAVFEVAPYPRPDPSAPARSSRRWLLTLSSAAGLVVFAHFVLHFPLLEKTGGLLSLLAMANVLWLALERLEERQVRVAFEEAIMLGLWFLAAVVSLKVNQLLQSFAPAFIGDGSEYLRLLEVLACLALFGVMLLQATHGRWQHKSWGQALYVGLILPPRWDQLIRYAKSFFSQKSLASNQGDSYAA